MNTDLKRVTVYFDAELHKALRLKAAELDRSLSDLVNEAVQQSLSEDAEDLVANRERVKEKAISFERVVTDMKRRGKL